MPTVEIMFSNVTNSFTIDKNMEFNTNRHTIISFSTQCTRIYTNFKYIIETA